ncbi:DHHC zinc finger domain, putative [Plasmodium yoelii yoelii]|uniref:Palmitoyltransferase n=1 Tax=Plasmodium yoelii yoelii TaxID=73239 RepID=Q7RML8_PLAYO|nr:DHHC zinc finger domain, putative [Plasmodium yoelii yoelii]
MNNYFSFIIVTSLINAEENNIQIENRKIRNYTPNKYTICDKCNYLVRPERAHHCRTCQRCVLKMDHHCPWIGTCVGEKNLKFFFLFLIYGLFISLFVNITIMPQFVKSIYETDEAKESYKMHHAAIFISVSATTTLAWFFGTYILYRITSQPLSLLMLIRYVET